MKSSIARPRRGIPANAPSAWREACGSDAELLREVESLLASDQALAIGTEIGCYRIESILGEGGMGVVYRALDTRLKRPVAVKVLADEAASAAARRRFQREAQTASSLNHPHIVTVYDAGEFHGRQYLVPEFVDHGTLKNWSKTETRTWRQVVEILVGVADGLAAAHTAGILHRDIKPDNILVAKNGYAKLADFGLAKLEEGAPSDATRTLLEHRTGVGMILGTIPYMSPEQAAGKAVDARSDIFSFGVVLYEALANVRPFTAAGDRELLAAIRNDTPAPLPRELPVGLRMAVEKALEKDPAERYQATREMVVDLRRLLRQSVDEVAPLPVQPPPVQPPARRRWAPLAAAAVGIAAIALIAGHFLWPSPEPAVWSGVALGGPDVAMAPRLAPDGHTLAFLALVAGQTQVGVMRPEAGNWSILTHSRERGSVVASSWSHDGNKIYYDRVLDVPRGVYSVPVLGDEEQLVLESAMLPEALPDGTLIVARYNSQHELQLFHFWPESGRLQPFPLQVFLGLFAPQLSAFPDGREVLVLGGPTGQGLEPAKDLYILDVAAGKARRAVSRNHSMQIQAPRTIQTFRLPSWARVILHSSSAKTIAPLRSVP